MQKSEQEDLPEGLRGLAVNEEGDLVDAATGKAINEFGATRFDVAVRALRGELSPEAWDEDTERAPGAIMGRLLQFPCDYVFQARAPPPLGGVGLGFGWVWMGVKEFGGVWRGFGGVWRGSGGV